MQPPSALEELEPLLSQSALPQRSAMLRKITDLFLSHSGAYTEELAAIFDSVMGRLMEGIDQQALIALSTRLGPADRAPRGVIARLSQDDDIAVAGPVLEQSGALDDDQLAAVARTKSQAHLAAIAGRRKIAVPITDILTERGDDDVRRKLAGNEGARFSHAGFSRTIQRAQADAALAVALASRIDLPPELFEALVEKATAEVRSRLVANAGVAMRRRIAEVLCSISEKVARAANGGGEDSGTGGRAMFAHDPAQARERLARSIETRNLTALIEALASAAGAPGDAVADLVRQQSEEGVLIAGKAAGLGWPQMQDVLSLAIPGKAGDIDEMKRLFSRFANLSPASAQRAVGVMRASRTRMASELLRAL